MKKLIVGLGNPDKKYQITRHNAGFIIVDALADSVKATWKNERKFKGELARNDEIIFLKPSTYMNLSGDSVQKVLSYFDISTDFLYIVHDDADLELFKVKIQFAKSSGGHHGVEDIISKVGTTDFWRIRIGIGRPSTNQFDIEDFVLSKFSNDELSELNNIAEEVKKNIL